jgi:2-polyprenyl-3-methyl-5-hydroxy-6-metoxy-1,4-benzoquinol methylase
MPAPCPTCHGRDRVRIATYKRWWDLCRTCGTGTPEQRERYPLERLPVDVFKRDAELDDASIYDYFVTPSNVAAAKEEAAEFVDGVLGAHDIDVSGKAVLDVSGGNGHVAAAMAGLGADMTLTEINRPALEYAQRELGLHAVEYRFEDGPIAPRVDGRTYDIVLLRACVMFTEDLPALLRHCREVMNDGGLLMIDRSVKPTLGTLLRVQLDEFSYLILRQPETVVAACEEAGLSVFERVDEVDADPYVNHHDMDNGRMFLRYRYEIPAARVLRTARQFDFPARDRRRSRLLARRD